MPSSHINVTLVSTLIRPAYLVLIVAKKPHTLLGYPERPVQSDDGTIPPAGVGCFYLRLSGHKSLTFRPIAIATAALIRGIAFLPLTT